MTLSARENLTVEAENCPVGAEVGRGAYLLTSKRPGRPKGLGKVLGSGRRPGVPNKKTAEVKEILLALKCDPISGMAGIAMNRTNGPELRGRMYAELAGFLFPKRKATEISGPNDESLVPDISMIEVARRISFILTQGAAESGSAGEGKSNGRAAQVTGEPAQNTAPALTPPHARRKRSQAMQTYYPMFLKPNLRPKKISEEKIFESKISKLKIGELQG